MLKTENIIIIIIKMDEKKNVMPLIEGANECNTKIDRERELGK